MTDTKPECSIEGCDKPALARGWCSKHWQRWQKHGDPLATLRKTAPERFWEKVAKSDDCWIWTGSQDGHGYGSFSFEGRPVKAHRFSYEQEVGPIPAGLDIDHICGVRACVNPAHLRTATRKQNMENAIQLRSINKSGAHGVSWDAARGKWHAQVMHDGKTYYIGHFTDIADAKLAVVAKRNELFTHNDADRRPA